MPRAKFRVGISGHSNSFHIVSWTRRTLPHFEIQFEQDELVLHVIIALQCADVSPISLLACINIWPQK